MATKKKAEILEDVGEYLDENLNEAQEGPESIKVPVNVVEALIVAVATGDRNAINNVGAEIRAIAEIQNPDKFKR